MFFRTFYIISFPQNFACISYWVVRKKGKREHGKLSFGTRWCKKIRWGIQFHDTWWTFSTWCSVCVYILGLKVKISIRMVEILGFPGTLEGRLEFSGILLNLVCQRNFLMKVTARQSNVIFLARTLLDL